MTILALLPARTELGYALFTDTARAPAWVGRSGDYRGPRAARSALAGVRERLPLAAMGSVDAIGVRLPFGGELFRRAELLSADTRRRLASLAPNSPLAVPAALGLLDACGDVFPGTPVVLAFETAFFADLPTRERLYAVGGAGNGTRGLRRYGYHGLFHQAAVAAAACAGDAGRVRRCARNRALRSPRWPGGRLVMVTGEPPCWRDCRQTSCGEIDPAIIWVLARANGWGPEQINHVLTRDSGLSGLAGERVSVLDVLTSGRPELQLARDVLEYRMLLAAGAGVAALSGLDHIVFSGRFARAGDVVGPWLVERLSACRREGPPLTWSSFSLSLERLVADTPWPCWQMACGEPAMSTASRSDRGKRSTAAERPAAITPGR